MKTPAICLAAAGFALVGCADVVPTPYVGGLTPTQVYAILGPYTDDDRVYSVPVVGDPALAYDPRLFPQEQPKNGRILMRQMEFVRRGEYPITVFFRKQRGRWIAYEQHDPTTHYKDVQEALR